MKFLHALPLSVVLAFSNAQAQDYGQMLKEMRKDPEFAAMEKRLRSEAKATQQAERDQDPHEQRAEHVFNIVGCNNESPVKRVKIAWTGSTAVLFCGTSDRGGKPNYERRGTLDCLAQTASSQGTPVSGPGIKAAVSWLCAHPLF